MKTTGAAIPLIHGQFGLLPYFPRNGVTMVLGGGIGLRAPKEREAVSKEELDAGHALYVQKLRELFEREKEALGYGDRELVIL